MINLIKYEIRKQLISKIILFGLLIFFQLWFVIGLLLQNVDLIKVSHALFLLLAVAGMIYLIIEPASVLSSDLGKKQGYLLFMTPNTTVKIIGAKILTGWFPVILFFTIVISFTRLNDIGFSWYLKRNIDSLSDTFNAFGDVGFSVSEFLVTTIFISCIVIDFITLAFLATSISYTYLAKGKVNSFMSIVLFVILFIVESLFFGVIFILPFNGSGNTVTSFIVIVHMLYLIPAILNYYCSVKLIDRRVSL